MRRLALLLWLLPLPLAAAELDARQQARYQVLINELRCLVCQNQTIAESNAPLANDLREQVQAQLLAGRSDAEIRAWLTERYGDFVLYRPPFKASTLLLWLGPLGLVLAGLYLAWRQTRRALPPPVAPDPAALRRLLDEDR
jgi:cytochrome c-type biogenesis protein CcmH